MPDDRCPKCPDCGGQWGGHSTVCYERQLAAMTERAEKAEADSITYRRRACEAKRILKLVEDELAVRTVRQRMEKDLKACEQRSREKAEGDLAEVQSKLDRCETVDALRIREIHSYATKQDDQRKRIAELEAEVKRLREALETIMRDAEAGAATANTGDEWAGVTLCDLGALARQAKQALEGAKPESEGDHE